MKPCPWVRRVKRRWRAAAGRLPRAPGQLAKPGRYGLFVTARLTLAGGARLTRGDGVGSGTRRSGETTRRPLRRYARHRRAPPLGVISQRHRGEQYIPGRAASTTKCPPNKPAVRPPVQDSGRKTFTADVSLRP